MQKSDNIMTIDGWVARDECDDIFLYGDKPKRFSDYWFGSTINFKLPHTSFPSLTWESDPLEVTIAIKPKKKLSTE